MLAVSSSLIFKVNIYIMGTIFIYRCFMSSSYGHPYFFPYYGCLFFWIVLLKEALPMDHVDEWKRKLIMLLHSKDKQELISREKRDKRDFEQIASMASKMGLYRYALVVYCS